MTTTIQTRQTALLLTYPPTGLSSLKLVWDLPVPSPRPAEVLVKVEAASLNPVDAALPSLEGHFIDGGYPLPLGVDIAGEVVQLGEGVEKEGRFKVGDKVVFEGTYIKDDESTGFQQYARAEVATLSKYPPSLSAAQASTLPVVLTTAYLLFYHHSLPHGMGLANPFVSASNRGAYEGIPMVVLGGASSVGQVAIQLAKLGGFSPIITTASTKHEGMLKKMGATHVLERGLSSEGIVAAVRAILGQSERSQSTGHLKHVVDAISTEETQKLGIALLQTSTEGRVLEGKEKAMLALTLPSRVTTPGDVEILFTVGLKQYHRDTDLVKIMWEGLYAFLEAGDIQPNQVEILPGGLEGVVPGLQRLSEKTVSGTKLVALPQQTV